jgi:carbonic anhydrase/acetyltransferase-like protein (isoleucine patch superfamily)
MLIARNDQSPQIAPDPLIAASAQIIGSVWIGAGAYIDHGVVIESSGPPIEIGEEAVVFAGAVVRSVGGQSRPAFAVRLGERALISLSCVLTGCQVGHNCYIATGAIVLHGASIGDHVRVGAGAIVHASTALEDHARVGMRHVAVPTPDGYLSTADIETARRIVAELDFFQTAFGTRETDQVDLHEHVMTALLDEVHGWHDEPSRPEGSR